MIKLSFCAIVKNEAQNLARCLTSVEPYVDELVIVDTGSKDETVAIAQQNGAKIDHFEWCDDFAAARNYALSLVTGDWILTLDADEELIVHSPTFKSLLTSSDTPLAYGLTRKDTHEVGDISGGLHLRLFRNLPELRYSYRYHEQLQRIDGLPLHLGTLNDIEILHHGNSDENVLHKNLTRDIPILEKMRLDVGLDLWRLDCLARKYIKANQPNKAQDCYAEALDRLSPNLIDGNRPEPFFWVPTLLEALGIKALEAEEIETVRLICQRGLEWCPNHPPLNHLTGELMLLLGFPKGALAYFQYCLKMGQDHTYYQGDPFSMSFVQSFAAYGLGGSYLALQDLTNARLAFQACLDFDPTYQDATDQLSQLEKISDQP